MAIIEVRGVSKTYHDAAGDGVIRTLDKISLAPRQTLCLVEAEGRRFLVANSPQCAPAFYPLESREFRTPNARVNGRRASW